MLNFVKLRFLSNSLFYSKRELNITLISILMHLIFIFLVFTGAFITIDLDSIINEDPSNREFMMWVSPDYVDSFSEWSVDNERILSNRLLNVNMDEKIGFVVTLRNYSDRHKLLENLPSDIGMPSIATHFMDTYENRLSVIKISILVFIIGLFFLFLYINRKYWKAKNETHDQTIKTLSILGYKQKSIFGMLIYQTVKYQFMEISISLLIYRLLIWPIFVKHFDYIIGNSIDITYHFSNFRIPIIVLFILITSVFPVIFEKHDWH